MTENDEVIIFVVGPVAINMMLGKDINTSRATDGTRIVGLKVYKVRSFHFFMCLTFGLTGAPFIWRTLVKPDVIHKCIHFLVALRFHICALTHLKANAGSEIRRKFSRKDAYQQQ